MTLLNMNLLSSYRHHFRSQKIEQTASFHVPYLACNLSSCADEFMLTFSFRVRKGRGHTMASTLPNSRKEYCTRMGAWTSVKCELIEMVGC